MVSSRLEKIMYREKPIAPPVGGFDFNRLTAPPLMSLLSEWDMRQLYEIAVDPKLSARIKKKYNLMNQILNPRGFKLLGRGTNRCAYKHYEFPNIVLKVPVDKIGLLDGYNEYRNQWELQPFVTKTFEVHPSGVSLHERVQPLTAHRELELLADDYFNLVTKVFIGKYVMEDIGEQYFMNWGIRPGFGLVLLDYPYLFELDIAKLRCNNPDPRSPYGVCMGEIDYDMGFNHLYCSKCGKRYAARELGKAIESNQLTYNIFNSTGGTNMENVVVTITKNGVSKTFGGGRKEVGPLRRRPEKPSHIDEPVKVTITRNGVSKTFCEGKVIGTSDLTYKAEERVTAPVEDSGKYDEYVKEVKAHNDSIGDEVENDHATPTSDDYCDGEDDTVEVKEAEVITEGEDEPQLKNRKSEKGLTLRVEKEHFAGLFKTEAVKYFSVFKEYGEEESTEELFRASMEELVGILYNENSTMFTYLKIFDSYKEALIEEIMEIPEIKEFFAEKNSKEE